MSSWSKVDLKKLKTKCDKCNRNTELVIKTKLPKKKKTYTYTLATRCSGCFTYYYYDDSKMYFVEKDKSQEQLINLSKANKVKNNPFVDYVVPETINFPDL